MSNQQKYFAHQAIDGSWHCVFRDPASGSLESIGEFSAKAQAEDLAKQNNSPQG